MKEMLHLAHQFNGIINYCLSKYLQHLFKLGGRQLSYHASANAIDFNRIMSTFTNYETTVFEEEDNEEEDNFDEELDFDDDEELDGDDDEDLEDNPEDETENLINRNPFPPKSEWINTGYELCRLVFGPYNSSIIRTVSYKLSHVHDNLYEVGTIKAPNGQLVVPVPRNRRNVIQDAIRSWNIVQEFKNLDL